MGLENKDFSDEEQSQCMYTLYSRIFSSYNVSTPIFKKWSTNIIRLSTKNTNFKLWKFRAKFCGTYAIFPSRKFLFQWAWIYFKLKAVKAMEILSGEQMRGPRKM